MQISTPLTAAKLEAALGEIRDGVISWLSRRRIKNGAGFNFCENALAPVEVNATTCGVELWMMLGLPLSAAERKSWVEHLQSFQNLHTGLVLDPSWQGRQANPNPSQLLEGDTFFTMTGAAALEALGAGFRHPIDYLAKLDAGTLAQRTDLLCGAHNPYGVADYGRLILENRRLGVAGADEQWHWLSRFLHEHQDRASGLWPLGRVTKPLTPFINLSFHLLRSAWNLTNEPYSFPERMIDSCLAACEDDRFYGWENGYACNDLDLAVVAYSASRWTNHRAEELRQWAIRNLPLILSVRKRDGGFSFYHERAMEAHGGIRMSDGGCESDAWGTLMYLGTIKMMAALAWPGVSVPWGFSRVHPISSGPVL